MSWMDVGVCACTCISVKLRNVRAHADLSRTSDGQEVPITVPSLDECEAILEGCLRSIPRLF